MFEKREIDGRDCYISESQSMVCPASDSHDSGSRRSACLLIQPADDHDLEGLERETDYLRKHTEVPFRLAAVRISDWNRELSPWPAPPVWGDAGFSDGAADTLRFITEQLLPEMSAGEKERILLGGYSLAGLFSLWAGYQTAIFHGIAAASPSVWFPGFLEYAGSHMMLTGNLALSLGTKEEKTKNPVMARVGDNIRLLDEMYRQQGIVCTLSWNEGNHFREPDIRMAKAFLDLLKAFEN